MKKIEIIAGGRVIRPWAVNEPFWIRYDNVNQAYERPSTNKVNVWRRIEENANILGATVGINSRNCCTFTCHGFMLEEDGRSIEFKLTKSYCYVRYRY